MPNSNPACQLPFERSCRSCFGASLPSTVDWHNLDTGEHYTLNHVGGFTYCDVSDVYTFGCAILAVTIHAEILPDGASGIPQDCNYSNPIHYQFAMSDGSTVVVSAAS